MLIKKQPRRNNGKKKTPATVGPFCLKEKDKAKFIVWTTLLSL